MACVPPTTPKPRRRWLQFSLRTLMVLLSRIVVCLAAVPAMAQDTVDQTQEVLHARAGQILQGAAAGRELAEDAAGLIPILINIVERGERQASDLAIRVLGGLKSKAGSAAPVLCGKLNDPRHATRSYAVEALVAIGEDSVTPLRSLLHSPSGRTRAAATEAVSRLQRIDRSELERLATDADPRVRAAVAIALSRLGRSGVERLASYLTDSELAVSVEAARALQAYHEDPTIAIPILTDACARQHLGWSQANAALRELRTPDQAGGK